MEKHSSAFTEKKTNKKRKPTAFSSAAPKKQNQTKNKPQKSGGKKAASQNFKKSGAAQNRQKNIRSTTESTKRKSKTVQLPESPIKFIPLGGMGEIGKNCYLYSYNDRMLLVDCGMSFPDEETPGIDIVIPDFTYLLKNADKIEALIITHGHEDHIGAVPYLLKNLNLPIYGTKFTIGLIKGKLEEHGLLNKAKLNVFSAGDKLKFGDFTVEPIHINHSIPGAVAFAITTPEGTVLHTGDFKVDTTPAKDKPIDLTRFAEIGRGGVMCLMSDSTNAERTGYTPSEKVVGDSFESLFSKAGKSRIIIASFSSNVHRIQQIIDQAVKTGRKVAISGRSMQNAVEVAEELGYLKVPRGTLVEIEAVKNYPPDRMVIVTTGSQGEPLSALHRMAFGGHKHISIVPGDMIIISANPIPGNEKLVSKVINELLKQGANVVYEKMYDVHVSGHACQEELKLVFSLVKPKFFVPMHGEQRHLVKHAGLAENMGIDRKNILITDNGGAVEISRSGIKYAENVTAGRVLVDGLGVGDVGNVVLRDRKHLAEDGVIIVALTCDRVTHEVISDVEIVSRGFVYVKESEELIKELNTLCCDIIESNFTGSRSFDMTNLKGKIKDGVSKFLYEQTHRSPMILPIILEA
ncbi:MAG: ribonuclease J [Oscillospiraceae bacterium]|nr:ribonuclease J [Candidatus Equicaccousia limihippi]